MRRFFLHRTREAVQVNKGIVAEGVEFQDGSVAIRWLTTPQSTAIWRSLREAEQVHGYDGTTRFVFYDAA